jgi:hypothetical protein
MAPQRITLNPANPVQGQNVTICYNFTGSGITSTQLQVTYSPNGPTTTYTVTTSSPCVDVPVPLDATSILVEDLVGNSPDKSATVTPKT